MPINRLNKVLPRLFFFTLTRTAESRIGVVPVDSGLIVTGGILSNKGRGNRPRNHDVRNFLPIISMAWPVSDRYRFGTFAPRGDVGERARK